MSEPIKQQTGPGDPASGVQGGKEAPASKQPANNWDYADGFMMGLEDRGWTRLDRDLEDDIREQVDSLLEKLDVTGMEVRIGSLERALERVEGERDQQLRRVAELERERDSAAALANALLLDIGQIAEALGSEASEPAALLADAQALKARVAELEDALRGLAARYHRDAHEGDGIPEDAHEWDTAQRVLLGKEAET